MSFAVAFIVLRAPPRKRAARSLRPAKIGFGSGFSSVNVNRDVLTANGWWLAPVDAGPSNKTSASFASMT